VSILNIEFGCSKLFPTVIMISCSKKNIILLLFRHPAPSVLIPALRTVGNIVTGDDMQTQVLSSIISRSSLFSYTH
jgi:hypothetical protein